MIGKDAREQLREGTYAIADVAAEVARLRKTIEQAVCMILGVLFLGILVIGRQR